MGGTGDAFPAGKRLGPYELIERIGRGGMGDVYRAKDTRLGRDVAVKVLAASASRDTRALRRFRQEAQATSALSHPNIVTVFDVGTEGDAAYIVCELLHGETLRHLIKRNALTPRQTIEYAIQVASGLAAAHRKGILHRDIKPENLFVTTAGVVKILDFGLTKLTSAISGEDLKAEFSGTKPGVLLGTAGYVSPEQIREEPVDHRTDIFSLGVVLYELLAGRPPFRGDSPAETLSAILTDDPPELRRFRADLPLILEELVRACLEKDPDSRFQSAADVALSLRTVLPVLDAPRSLERAPLPVDQVRRRLTAALVAAALLAGGWMAGRAAADRDDSPPEYRRITFGRGTIGTARFKPGTGEVVYDAALNGGARDIFVTPGSGSEARALCVRNAELLAVSSRGEIALSLNRRLERGYVGTGTLAVMTEGQVPRELIDDVHLTDWAPDGASLAIVRDVEGRTRVEYPVDTVLFETAGWVSDLRVAPDGRRVAFVEHGIHADAQGTVVVAERGAPARAVGPTWTSILGLAWNGATGEIWVTADDDAGVRALRAIEPSGRTRVVAHAPGRVSVADIAPDGRVLLRRDDLRLDAIVRRRGETTERNLSWLDWSLARDISPDGTRLLIVESGDAVGSRTVSYVRPTDGSPATRLGRGSGLAFSPDGRRVLAIIGDQLVLLPTGAGEPITLTPHGILHHPWAGYFPDATRVVFTGSEPGRAMRVFVQEIPHGRPIPITPEAFRLSSQASVSPDGKTVIAVGSDDRLFAVPASGGTPRPLAGSEPGEAVVGWDLSGRELFVFHPALMPAPLFRLGMDGSRRLEDTLAPADLTGALAIHRIVMTPRADVYAYTLERQLSDLYVASYMDRPR